MSADKAGIKGGDIISEFAGKPVYSRENFTEMVNEFKDQKVSIKLLRPVGGKFDRREVVNTSVTPTFDESKGLVRIGITWNFVAVDADTIVRPLPSEQLREHAMSIFKFLKAITTPRQAKAAASNMGGPVAIIISYWYIVKASLMLAVWFTGFLNVNLAILNLLPIPVLDGGHMMFSLWEIVTRRPASPKVVNALVNFFLVLLLAFFVFITFRDVDRMTPARRFLNKAMGRSPDVTVTNEAGKTVPSPAGVSTNSSK